jgi:hypothetical protein
MYPSGLHNSLVRIGEGIMPTRHTEEEEVQMLSFLTSAQEGGEWLAERPGRIYPRHPLYRSLDGPQSRLDVESRGKILRRGSNPGRPVRSQSL